jgi:hypothetical protein
LPYPIFSPVEASIEPPSFLPFATSGSIWPSVPYTDTEAVLRTFVGLAEELLNIEDGQTFTEEPRTPLDILDELIGLDLNNLYCM